MGDVPEQVFIDAAKAYDLDGFYAKGDTLDLAYVAARPEFRAAVASAYRAGRAAGLDGVRCDCHGSLFIVGVGEPRWHVFGGKTVTTFEEFAKVAEGQVATPDGPRRWALPDDAEVEEQWGACYPGEPVARAKDREGALIFVESLSAYAESRDDAKRAILVKRQAVTTPWEPTDATPAAGQDGDGRG